MAKNITLMGANYPDVPAVNLPQTGGGNAMFVDAEEMGDIEDAIAIVIDGDTAPQAITSGQYLFIKNHSTLANGGYHATADIASGGTVSSSNVSADPDGIVNALRTEMADTIETTSGYRLWVSKESDSRLVIALTPNAESNTGAMRLDFNGSTVNFQLKTQSGWQTIKTW